MVSPWVAAVSGVAVAVGSVVPAARAVGGPLGAAPFGPIRTAGVVHRTDLIGRKYDKTKALGALARRAVTLRTIA